MYPGAAGHPMTPLRPYFSQLLSQKVTTHTLILEAALLYRIHVVDMGIGATLYYHNSARAVQLVNQALDDRLERCSDATIGAISMLALNEVSQSFSMNIDFMG
jgi:hypothetical protein